MLPAAAELAAHLGCQEAHVQDVQLIGEEMMAEAIGEHHDGVVGDRSVTRMLMG